MLFLQVVPVDKPVVRSVKKTEVMQDIEKCKSYVVFVYFILCFGFYSWFDVFLSLIFIQHYFTQEQRII